MHCWANPIQHTSSAVAGPRGLRRWKSLSFFVRTRVLCGLAPPLVLRTLHVHVSRDGIATHISDAVARNFGGQILRWQWPFSSNSLLTPVGFEPTQLAIVELESTPLDHSGKVSCAKCWSTAYYRATDGAHRQHVHTRCHCLITEHVCLAGQTLSSLQALRGRLPAGSVGGHRCRCLIECTCSAALGLRLFAHSACAHVKERHCNTHF